MLFSMGSYCLIFVPSLVWASGGLVLREHATTFTTGSSRAYGAHLRVSFIYYLLLF